MYSKTSNRAGANFSLKISALYAEFSACFEQCAIADPPEFKPLADLCVAKVAATPAQTAHLKMCLLVKVYYDYYTRATDPADRLEQLCAAVGDALGGSAVCVGGIAVIAKYFRTSQIPKAFLTPTICT